MKRATSSPSSEASSRALAGASGFAAMHEQSAAGGARYANLTKYSIESRMNLGIPIVASVLNPSDNLKGKHNESV